jgi:MoaA/NifB/PqqE/SkfB family radical SAM enzyme
MSKHYLKIKKLNDDDLDRIYKLKKALSAFDDNIFPRNDEDDEEEIEFDSTSYADLQKFHEIIMATFDDCTNDLSLLLIGYSTLTMPSNKLIDPDNEFIDFHPEIQALRESQETETDATTG